MSNIKAMPTTGFANCNADVAKFLRKMADNVEVGSHGEIRQVALIMEAGSDVNTWVAGGPFDNARIVGLMSIATTRFIRDMGFGAEE
jgi:diaminopimelate decarboxylase